KSIEDRIKNFFQSGGKYTELEVDWEERVGREI
nr:Chain C, PemI inhibitor [Staphylococcus aureus]7EWJ_F Chain F, PemI inhibitor [Staphylococcus aureus]7EWJ_I Chain I, PemI inhibitor [Staphylococcus aureus]